MTTLHVLASKSINLCGGCVAYGDMEEENIISYLETQLNNCQMSYSYQHIGFECKDGCYCHKKCNFGIHVHKKENMFIYANTKNKNKEDP